MFAGSSSDAPGKFSISFTNLSETDDIHAPLLLSSCGLKAEIFIRCGIYANM